MKKSKFNFNKLKKVGIPESKKEENNEPTKKSKNRLPQLKRVFGKFKGEK